MNSASRLCASRPTLVSAAFDENYDVTSSARCSAAQRGASGGEDDGVAGTRRGTGGGARRQHSALLCSSGLDAYTLRRIRRLRSIQHHNDAHCSQKPRLVLIV